MTASSAKLAHQPFPLNDYTANHPFVEIVADAPLSVDRPVHETGPANLLD
jgi:hypothetical protein